jgi:hypothetical protein
MGLTGGLSEVQKLRAQAYSNEYQAMMTGMNLFMTLQFMPLVPLIAFWTIVANTYIRFNDHPVELILVKWGAVAVTQIACLVYYFSLHEVYNRVLYIETELKPKVAVLLHQATNSFWGWERHLRRFGKANNPRFGD